MRHRMNQYGKALIYYLISTVNTMHLFYVTHINYQIQKHQSDMSFFGVELNAQLNRLYFQIRLKLSQNKFMPNFRTIYRSLAQYDNQITGVLDMIRFEKALNQNGIFLKKYQFQVFEKAYKEKQGYLNWFSFLGHLRQPMGPVRRQLVQKIFDSIDANRQGKLTPDQLFVHFNPNQIDSYKKNFKSEQQVFDAFLSLISTPQGVITRQQFISFYDDCNINFQNNDAFIRFVSSQWNYTPQKLQQSKQQQVKALSKQLRAKLIQKSQATKDEYLIRKLFEQFDLNQNYTIGPYELDLMVKKLGIVTVPKLIDPLLEKIDLNRSGFIEYDEFKKYLFNDPYPL